MNRVAKFEKISQKQYQADYERVTGNKFDDSLYEDIILPKRATKGSAGYDFYLNYDLEIKPHETIMILSGIRAKIDDDYVLMIFPRSGFGFKYRFQLDNTVGVIDSDYYNAENEGHIMMKLTNHSDKTFTIKKHQAFAQGVFMMYGITVDDEVEDVRVGGLGSTTK